MSKFFEILDIGDKKLAFWEETVVTLTVPEGLDLWNPNDTQAKLLLEKCENIVKSAKSTDSCKGYVLPFGYELRFCKVIKQYEIPQGDK